MPYEVTFDGDEGGFEMIPVGEYPAYINSIIEKGEGDKAYLNVRFVVADGPFKQRSVFTNCSLKKEAIWKIKNLLVAAGLVQKGTKGGVKWANEDLIGRKVGVRVSHEEYEGKQRENVQAIFALSGGAPAATPAAAPAAGAAPAAPMAATVKRL